MDFIVEDGTGLINSTSYATIEFSDAELGADWAASEAEKQQALIQASKYADLRWGVKIVAEPVVINQSLCFPKIDLYNRYNVLIESVPLDWKLGILKLAKHYILGTLYPKITESAKEIEQSKIKVGPISIEKKYLGIANSSDWKHFADIDILMEQYIVNTHARVVRA